MLTTSKMKKGFTLIELMTALSIFIIVMTISMSSILGVFDANRKSRSLKTVLNNLNLAVESMSKEIRFGKNYHCGSTGVITDPWDCSSGDTYVSFLSSNGVQMTYKLNAGTIEKQITTSGPFIAVTAPEIIIDDLKFYVLGTGTGNTLQPKVHIMLKSHAGTAKGRSDFILQTLISQRIFDI